MIVSRARSDDLAMCLTAVSQLYYHPYEVVVVADAAGLAAARASPLAGRLKLVPCERANISHARNLGIEAAGGDVVAFLDDDAVPEPAWLDHLLAPFRDAEVGATGGFVRGRNGISLQWGARRVRSDGRCAPLTLAGDEPVTVAPESGIVAKTEGTNMAVRRAVLVALGGFDTAFAFYLDETDLNLRLARCGHATTLVPRAQVQHGMAPSARRRADRMPVDLHDIGASSAVFWRKYGVTDTAMARAALIAEQRGRLVRHMIAGRCEPRDVSRVLATLLAGLDDGQGRPFGLAAMLSVPPPLTPVRDAPPVRQWAVHGGPIWRHRRLKDAAINSVMRGVPATVLRLSPTALYHRMSYTSEGYWLQTGGWLGRSVRNAAALRALSCRTRVGEECDRLASVRAPIDGPRMSNGSRTAGLLYNEC
ncbi:glycosyltransferase family 2 protein [Tranquillimonas rosea]|uniref:glycosyltransferase family 2 protein n=1 Tax=Tranquillimonas rosea TaxID=641238 RepID=UPI003BAD7E19